MNEVVDDPEICLCFHVHRRKLVNWIRIERPQRAAQLSDCFGAGTGCGWCRSYLEKLFLAAQDEAVSLPEIPDSENYRSQRQDYLREKRRETGPGENYLEKSS